MKRFWAALAVGLATITTVACGAQPDADRAEAAAASGWTQPPRVLRVSRDRAGIVVSGEGAAEGRVVLRDEQGRAYAASIDTAARFDLRLPALPGPLFYTTDGQIGSVHARQAGRLLIDQTRGFAVVLEPGGPSRSIWVAGARGPSLVIDYDGGMAVASGVSGPGQAMRILVGGREVASVVFDEHDSHWATQPFPLTAGERHLTIEAGREQWTLTLPIAEREPGIVEAGTATIVTWRVPAGGIQQTIIAGPTPTARPGA